MKSMCVCCVLAAMNTSLPILLFRSLIIWTSCGLYKAAALWSSAEHPPFVFRMANSAGTQPSGPVPVTRTLRAPRSYSFCNEIKNIEGSINHLASEFAFFGGRMKMYLVFTSNQWIFFFFILKFSLKIFIPIKVYCQKI